MSTALATLSTNLGVSSEEVTDVIRGMIISSKNQHGSVATNAELAIVTSTCAKYGLNPLVKECAAFVSGGKLSVVVMIDGYYSIVNRQPNFDGVEFEDKTDSNGSITAITCKMYIKNRKYPVTVTEYLNECNDTKSSVWRKWPARMLRHKAYIQAARMAFGFSELLDTDEVDRIKSNQPERDITPVAKIDYDAIDQAFAECCDIETLKQVAGNVRADLQAGNAWDKAKGQVVALHIKHKDRIESYVDNEEPEEDYNEQYDDDIDVEFDEEGETASE